MSYFVNPAAFSTVFAVPCAVADSYIKVATEKQLKVLLYSLRRLADGILEASVAEALGMDEKEARDALDFWVQAGVLNRDTVTAVPSPKEKAVVAKAERPTRHDVAVRGAEDERVRFLFAEAQKTFGRILKSNEAQTLLWLYDDVGLDIPAILLLLQYAAGENRLNITFVERTGMQWSKDGVVTAADAEQRITEEVRRNTAWHLVERAFGLERRLPSEKELNYAELWINEWHFDTVMLKAAYDACVDAKSKFSMPYTAKILEKWHTAGYQTPEDVKNAATVPAKSDSFATYDIDAFEKMLNNKD